MAQFPSTTSANGIWGMMAIRNALMGSNWPSANVTIIQTFTASSTWTCPTGVTSVDYLIVGGGGGGGTSTSVDVGGGGGAGGFRTGTGLSVTAGNTLTITVGAGQPSDTSGDASSLAGADSPYATISAAGGGRGGGNGANAGANGGCGGVS